MITTIQPRPGDGNGNNPQNQQYQIPNVNIHNNDGDEQDPMLIISKYATSYILVPRQLMMKTDHVLLIAWD